MVINAYIREVKTFWTAVDFDQLAFAEARALMRQTILMVGMHGAALANACYMPSGGLLVEFRWNGTHHNHCYWHLASACALDYAAVFGHSDDKSKILEGNGCNLLIPIEDLTACLDEWLNHHVVKEI